MDPQHLFHYAASDIICSIIFGSRFEYHDSYFKNLILMIEELTKLVFDPWAIVCSNSYKSFGALVFNSFLFGVNW